MRASALSTFSGDTTSFSLRSTADFCAPWRRSACPGSSKATAPSTHTIARPASPSEGEPAERVEPRQPRLADPRAKRRAGERPERLEQDRADRRSGQRRERRVRRAASRPGATPARRESRARRRGRCPRRRARSRARPFFQPMNAVIATNPRAIRSTLVTARRVLADLAGRVAAAACFSRCERPDSRIDARLHCANLGGVVQLVRTPACHAGGRGFESRRSRSNSPCSYSSRTFLDVPARAHRAEGGSSIGRSSRRMPGGPRCGG